jgi:4-azaleucine resistance transporter AzlC
LNKNLKSALKGVVASLPMTAAVIPWGILAGSFALEVGLTPIESQMMSAIIFTGAAQLVALGMLKAGVGLSSIIITTLLVTSRHFLYSLAMRERISPLPLKWRMSLGFLLTDQLFAMTGQGKVKEFDRWYALGAGLSFYVCWNLSTLAGIIAGQSFPSINEWGLDFAIAAMFIALVVPTIKKKSILICVVVSLVGAVICALLDVPGGLLISALIGMTCGFIYAKKTGEAL